MSESLGNDPAAAEECATCGALVLNVAQHDAWHGTLTPRAAPVTTVRDFLAAMQGRVNR